ncbi:hypothetical protein Ancab_040484 [Ancistrocladus abbreviatus]
MGESGAQYTFKVHDSTKIVRSMRKEPPAHYRIEIDSFTSFQRALPMRRRFFKSTQFYVEGYRWVLSIYLNGKEVDNGKDHISLYLQMAANLGDGYSSINATCKFFIYDYIKKMYLVVQGLEVYRFDDIEIQQGISRVLSLNDFTNASNGFLSNGRSMFGVEVTIVSATAQTANLRALNVWRDRTFTWAIPNFSECLMYDYVDSDEFPRRRSWRLQMHPKGWGKALGKGLSLYLCLMNSSDLTNGRKLFVHMELRLKNMKNEPDKVETVVGCYTSFATIWGSNYLASLSDVHNSEKGFKLDDQLIVEVELKELHLMADN